MIIRKNYLLGIFLLHTSCYNLCAREKAYLHFDNSAYFLKDTLRFSAYVMDTETKRLTEKSQILYVELLAPDGMTVETRKYQLKHGRCAGDIYLRPLLLSGIFEVRAYTRYMLNDMRENYFSKAIPVYETVSNGQYSSPSVVTRAIRNEGRKDKRVSYFYDREECCDWNGNYALHATDSLSPLIITGTYDKLSLQPFGCVTVKLKGHPKSKLSLSISDFDNYAQIPSSMISDFIGGNIAAAKNFANSLRYSVEKGVSVQGLAAFRRKRILRKTVYNGVPNCNLAPLLYVNSDEYYPLSAKTNENGRFCIDLGFLKQDSHVLIRYQEEPQIDKEKRFIIDYVQPKIRKFTDAELELLQNICIGQKKIKVQQIDKTKNRFWKVETRPSFHFDVQIELDKMLNEDEDLTSADMGTFDSWSFHLGLLDKYYDLYCAGIASVILPGDCPGDSAVPKNGTMVDAPFSVCPYKELVIRSDKATCDYYSFDSHELKQNLVGFNYGHWTGAGGHGNPTGSPSVVVCYVPAQKEEWENFVKYNKVLNYRYIKVKGISPLLPYNQPNYSKSHPEHDYRRTLYWNPNLQLDENGEATIQFYNNGTCKKLYLSGEGVSEDGRAIIVK